MDDHAAPFDRRAVRRHRDRVASGFHNHDFLVAEVAARLAERLADVGREFEIALDLGCHTGVVGRDAGVRQRVGHLIQCDLSPAMVAAAAGARFVADEERLPVRDQGLDLVISALSLHWTNDLPGVLIQIQRALRPDGLFVGAMIGGNTLQDLHAALIESEMNLTGGASPRISPFADVRDIGALLQRAGFALPVVDRDRITVTYADAMALMRELRAMGEANALHARSRRFTRRGVLAQAAALYQSRHQDHDGRIPAHFDILYMTAWAPHDSQPRALRPGSASHRLADALGTREHGAGEASPRGPKADAGG